MANKNNIELYREEFTKWLNVLEKYHTFRFDKNYRQYTAFTETQGTRTRISDPVAPELIERVIQKLFEREPKFYSLSRGKSLPRQITDVMASAAEYYWTSPETVEASGIFSIALNSLDGL